MVLAILGTFALIALIDLRPLIKRRKWRAVAAFSLVFAAALTLALLPAFDIQVPSIMKAWKSLYEWLGLIYKP